MKPPKKETWLILAAVLFVIVCVALVRPEFRYRRALLKYKPGLTAEQIERDYGVHLDLQPSGNIFPNSTTENEKRRHPAYEAYVPQDYVMLTFNSDREIIDVAKLTPLSAMQKLFGL